MGEMPFGKPARLGHILQRLVRKKGLAEESTKEELNKLWKTTAGERVATCSWVRTLRSGVLDIAVNNGTILEELTCYLKHDLLSEIQQSHPDQNIKSLKFTRIN